MEECPICKGQLEDGQPVVCLRQKGSDGINNASIARGTNIFTCIGQYVHVHCRRDYIHIRNSLTNSDINNNHVTSRSLRSEDSFDFKTKCLFCTKNAKVCANKRGYDVFPVRSFEFQKTVHKLCNERKDEWAVNVLSRLSLAIDLPAAEAVYHQTCNVNFRTGRQIPKCFQDTEAATVKKSPIRRGNEEQASAFAAVIDFIENADDAVAVNDLVKVMSDICGDKAYSCKHMKAKILEHFGNSILISTLDGKCDIVSLKQTAASIMHKFYKRSKSVSADEEKKIIIATAAKLIKHDISMMESSKTFYPSFSAVSSVEENTNFLPVSLQYFMEKIVGGKDNSIKTAAIGQAIVQACRPKGIIAPLQVGLGIQLHHHFGSKFLIDTLSSLGFSSSYWEVQKFESNAAAALNTSLPSFFPGCFLQFVADNVDHNIRTLDGHNTFHGMGIIACSTPGSSVHIQIPRCDISSNELSALGKIDIKYFKGPEGDFSVDEFLKLDVNCDNDKTGSLFDTFTNVIWPFRRSRPSWSGFMQMFESSGDKTYQSKSSITFMPMIDMSPSDDSCIYSTLHFVCDQSAKYGVTPILTFDQPLFQKATYIINCQNEKSPLRKLVLRLGGFHTEMSFLGSIGHLMAGSGLQELLEVIYAPNAVVHMMSGKATARALRGHFLVNTALHALIVSKLFGIELTSTPLEDQEPSIDIGNTEHGSLETYDAIIETNQRNGDQTLLNDIAVLYDKLEKEELDVPSITQNIAVQSVAGILCEERKKLEISRTAKLWFMYIDMISILQQFIRAERTGDWILHLSTLKKMLPYFAASGHNLYLKSAYIYLQNMLKLEKEHPDVYLDFQSGSHVIRRSNRYWAGLSSDLVIEQVLMRSVKSTGGLTRGRGMTEMQRTQWLLSMPASAEMNNAMQEFCETVYKTNAQHKDVGKSRLLRDEKDTSILLDFLQERNPFEDSDTSLRNIETGVSADVTVNVDDAHTIGHAIMEQMVGKVIDQYSFKRSLQAVTLSAKTSPKVTDEIVNIDPQLLFQRLTTAASRYVDNIADIFQYELCGVPSGLFDNTGLPREPQKSNLAESIWKFGDCEKNTDEACEFHYVIDGGSLLQKIPWQKNSSFGAIFAQYSDYLLQKYTNPTVVFDGYSSGPNTKDVTHLRRTKGVVGTRVKFSKDTPFKSNKEAFLRNTENKQNFLLLLGGFLSENGIKVIHASGDADCLIVQTAITSAINHDTFVIGEDTDLLVLLCYHVGKACKKVYFRSDSRQKKNKTKVWDIHKTQEVLGMELCSILPFIHALTGCDTTSRIYGIGKGTALKAFSSKAYLREIAGNFMKALTKDEISETGEQALICLFGGLPEDNLNILRFKTFATKVMTSTSCVQVYTLPPTTAAAVYHSYRVHIQTQTWIGNDTLNPLDWGWEMINSKLLPKKTDLPPAPESLLQIIRCNCKTNCDSRRCSCRKHGLQCSAGCGDCRGTNCTNSPTTADIDIEDYE
ncbi:uncharacterized protein LOC123533634 [Mercenaria mercenaria]|uniref:uncharacterized protein LOC123533634 n=1 Tax=Mercenaria mercenaria TaxID=6596 RepID=UPI00234E9A5E|nr:uncharacterized protein LOC123533634 [Mercenaria mercenaria]